MKIIAIIIVVAVIGFAVFKITQKSKTKKTTPAKTTPVKRTKTTPRNTTTAGYDSTGKPVKLPSETPEQFAEREQLWSRNSGGSTPSRSDYYSNKR